MWGDVVDGSTDGSTAKENEPDAVLTGPLSRLRTRPGAVVLLWGGPGSGKSTLAIKSAPPGTKVLTNEMAPDLVLAYARRLRATLGSAQTPHHAPDGSLTWPDAGLTPEPAIVLDSITGCPDPIAALRSVQLRTMQTDGIALVIAQATKAGEMRGDRRIEHDAHCVIRVHPGGRYDVTKNRYGPVYSGVFTLQERRPRYYSVEGERGAYRLEPHPATGSSAPYAAPLRAWERAPSTAPPPPLAVAALASALYPGGYLEPDDADARREYAESQGIPYWSPNGYADEPERNAQGRRG